MFLQLQQPINIFIIALCQCLRKYRMSRMSIDISNEDMILSRCDNINYCRRETIATFRIIDLYEAFTILL